MKRSSRTPSRALALVLSVGALAAVCLTETPGEAQNLRPPRRSSP